MTQPSLKSASGSGFSFEDKVAALLFCELMAGVASLGAGWKVVERVERQAADWEPFGDLLLTVPDREGITRKCGCSVKSNRQFNSNGCSAELRDNLWNLLKEPFFKRDLDAVGLFCAELSNDVSPVLNQLCARAREEDRPCRLDEKVTDRKHRQIYDSFHHTSEGGEAGMPWHILSRLIPREFDFEDFTSRSEATAIKLCGQILDPQDATEDRSLELWKGLLDIARDLRDAGGSVTRERLASKLRRTFRLREDPSDAAAWTTIRNFSQEWADQIDAHLANGMALPRSTEMEEIRQSMLTNGSFHVVGESGAGKSALVKTLATETARSPAGAEVVWIKADQFSRVLDAVSDFVQVLLRARVASGLIIFDGLDACYEENLLSRIGQTVSQVTADPDSPWSVVLVCQTREWTRISRHLVKAIAGHNTLTKRVVCGDFSQSDMSLVFEASPSIRRLASIPGLYRALACPKTLDLLLRGQLAENLTLAGEADLVEWWWQEQVAGGRQFAAEESIARKLASRMAADLVAEVSPDIVEGPADSVEKLIQRRVLRRTRDGRLRFDHDLLADWSRVVQLRSLGDSVLPFMRANAENPPWLRAMRLLSQHLLERASDISRWCSVVEACKAEGAGGREREEPPAADLQVLDAWLEGIAHCSDALRALETVRERLFADNGWLLRRLVRRLLHSGTTPDPVVQQQFQQVDVTAAEDAAMLYRLPLPVIWGPVLSFLLAIPSETTACIPVEIAEIGRMWARLEQYTKVKWVELANLVLFNAETELRKEVAGEYRRRETGSHSLTGGHKSRVAIYLAALAAASQVPDRAAKLVLKAAGRIPWEEGDLSERADRGWRGEWHDDAPFVTDGCYVREPIESWPEGPIRRVSTDFSRAWFDSNASLSLYRTRTSAALEATLAFLIDWPRKVIIQRDHHGTGIEHHGFRWDGNHWYPSFWTKGPFLAYFAADWKSALELVVRLTNFATDRYQEWWPYEPGVQDLCIPAPHGLVHWKGNHQIFAWNHFHMNTSEAVTCALMALEKWLDQEIAANRDISGAVELLFQEGRSLAFAGVLVSIGKRHPANFLTDLKPLLFAREIYMFDLQTVRDHLGAGYWPREGRFLNELRREWNELPGRKEWLKDLCLNWLLTRPEFEPVFKKVSTEWRKNAELMPNDSQDRLGLLRWSAGFERMLWKEVTLPDGVKAWQNEMPEELRDKPGEDDVRLKQEIIMLPYQCSDMLKKRPKLDDEKLEGVWKLLQNWAPYEGASSGSEGTDEISSAFLDHRHARSGLLAVLLCLGREWLQRNSTLRQEVEAEVQKLLTNPPQIEILTPDDNHDDFDAFMARSAVQCWAASPQSPYWRRALGQFVTAYRYRTVQHLFDEAFPMRPDLGQGYQDLEALALSFAVVRGQAKRLQFRSDASETGREAIQNWADEWLPRFAEAEGPAWVADWSKVEKLEDFRPKADASYGMGRPRFEVGRRDYGFDMGVVLAAFEHLPALAQAKSDIERAHWLGICEQMIAAFCRTLPTSEASDNVEWKYEHWKVDERVFEIAARRLFECSAADRPRLWRPILDLPPAAHHHISEFLQAVLLEALRTDPLRIAELVPIWQEMANHLLASEKWINGQPRETNEVWKEILLYGTPFTSTGEAIFAPLVDLLRPHFERHVHSLTRNAHEQSTFVGFLTTKAGDALLVQTLVWLGPSWQAASSYFWDTVVEHGRFEDLLDYAWRHRYAAIRSTPDALQAFKTLTLNLAARHVRTALQIQQQIGSELGEVR